MADPQRAQSLLRCAQELMTNAARHSGAQNLWLVLRRCDAGIELSAHDDGCGAANIAPGGGLTGMAARFRELGGRFEIDSEPERGFRVTAWLP